MNDIHQIGAIINGKFTATQTVEPVQLAQIEMKWPI